MVIRRFYFLFISVLLSGCASTGLQDRYDLRKFLQGKDFQKAEKLVNESKDFADERNKLLKFLELGSIKFQEGKFEEAAGLFEKSRTIADELYTTSLSKKIQSATLSESFDQYYGEVYERTSIFYFLSLSHLQLYLSNQKIESLYAARSAVVAWDSYLNSIKDERLGKTVFKNDLLAKLYGAQVHELVGTREDLQIALQLYKDAKDVLFKNYNSYKSFNEKFLDFKKNYASFPKMSVEDISSKFVSETSHSKMLNDYVDSKILHLTKELRPSEFEKSLKSKYKDKKIIDELEKKYDEIADHKLKSVSIVLNTGMIPLKIPEKHYYSIESYINSPDTSDGAKVVAAVGAVALKLYAIEKLGLLPPPTSYRPGGVYFGVNTADVFVDQFSVGFELPQIETSPPAELYRAVLKDGAGQIVQDVPVTLVNPFNDIAEEAIFEKSQTLYPKLGMRMAGKYLAAIGASYATYKAFSGGNKDNEFLARNAALLQFLGATKVIEQTEKADTRFWSTLPKEARLVEFYVPTGNYQLFLIKDSADKLEIDLGAIQVSEDDQKKLVFKSTY